MQNAELNTGYCVAPKISRVAGELARRIPPGKIST
jgi:hypothetical protein